MVHHGVDYSLVVNKPFVFAPFRLHFEFADIFFFKEFELINKINALQGDMSATVVHYRYLISYLECIRNANMSYQVLIQKIGLLSDRQRGIVESLVDEFLRKGTEIVRPKIPVSLDSPPFTFFPKKPVNDRLIQFLLLVWTSPSEDVDDLAYEAGLSFERIRHLCQEDIGVSGGEAVKKIRLEKCRHELKETSKNVSEIALNSGFENFSSFSRMFKDAFGEPPRTFRQMCTQGHLTSPAHNQPK